MWTLYRGSNCSPLNLFGMTLVNIMPLSVNRAWLCMWTYSIYDSSVSAYRSKGVFCKPTAIQGLNRAGIDNRTVDPPDPRANSEPLEKVWCGENPTTVSLRENNSMGNVQGLLFWKNFSSCLYLSPPLILRQCVYCSYISMHEDTYCICYTLTFILFWQHAMAINTHFVHVNNELTLMQNTTTDKYYDGTGVATDDFNQGKF